MSTPNPEEHKRIVDAAVNIMKKNNPDILTPAPKDDLDTFMERLETATIHVRNQFKPIYDVHQEQAKSLDNKQTLIHLHKLYLEQFKSWPKDDLVFACALIHAHTLKETLI